MKLTMTSLSLRDALQGVQVKPVVILSVSTLTLITWKCFASPQYYLENFASRFSGVCDPQVGAAVYNFAGALLLMGILPALIVKFGFREKLSDYGVCLGNRVRTVRSFLVYSPGIVLVAYLSAQNPSFWKEYPINHHAGASTQMFGLHALTYLMFYLGWEFQFRGFMQYGLRDSMGSVNALLVQVMASVTVHIGKPTGEIYGSIVGGLIWGILAFRTRSLLSGLLQHALLGILLDWFICHPH
jgi:membrane protease YdiL (CAAX protease family)